LNIFGARGTSCSAVLLGTALPLLLCAPGPSVAAPWTQGAAQEEDLELSLLEIRLERVKQQILVYRSLLLAEEMAELARLVAQADSSLRSGDLEAASVHLLEIEVTLETLAEVRDLDVEDVSPSGKSAGASRGRWDFQWATAAGVDLWQQRYTVPVGRTYSGASEGEANPYASLRSTLSGDLPFGSSTNYLELRLSKDYGFGVADGNASLRVPSLGRIGLDYQLSGTDYRAEDWRDFVQIEGEVRWELISTAAVSFGPQIRWSRVHYFGPEEDLFLSYRQTEYGVELGVYPSPSTSLRAGWRTSDRVYDETSVYNFVDQETRVSLSGYSSSLLCTAWFTFLDRDFPNGGVREYGAMSYRDLYADGRLHWVILRPWGIAVEGSWELRDYDLDTPVVPDFREYRIQIGLLWQPDYRASVSAGPIFRGRKDLSRSAGLEDFTTVGLGLNVGFYGGATWSLQMTTNYESRDYLRDLAAVTPSLALYSDRSIIDNLLLFTWRFQKDWELSLTVNLNREDDRRWSEQDVQSTLFSFQITRFF